MRGLYKRGNIYWMSYTAGNRVIRESTHTSNQKLAEGVLCKRRAEVFEGRWSLKRRTKIPLDQAIHEFLTVYAKPRKVSWREDERILGRFKVYAGRNAYLQDIDRKTIERFQLTLLSEKLSTARVNRYTATLKCFFNRCIDWEKIESNPCRGIRMHPEMPRMRWLDAGQVARLLESCSSRLRPIVQVALLTGLRIGDILRLTWDQIHLEEHIIRVTQGKTHTPLFMPISRALESTLRSIPRDSDCPYVFQTHRKGLGRSGWLRTDFEKATQTAGLPGIRFHDLRHTAATHLRRLGRDLQVVQQLLGHKSIRMTMRYSHVHPEELREAADLLGEHIIPRHFTIASQPEPTRCGLIRAPVQNDAILQLGEEALDSGPGEIREAVNPCEAPSEDW